MPRGGWDNGGSWVPVAFIDNDAAGCLFRAKVLSFLTGEKFLSDERARVLLGWDHNSGFSVDDSVRFEPEDRKSMEQVARYLLRPPLSLERMGYSDGDDEVVYRRKGPNGREVHCRKRLERARGSSTPGEALRVDTGPQLPQGFKVAV